MADHFEASKFLEKSLEGEVETRKFHVVFPTLDVKLIEQIYEDNYDDDWESCCFHWGMYVDWEGDLNFIDVDKFIDGLNDKIEDMNKDDEYEKEDIEKYKELVATLEKVEGHTLYPREKPVEAQQG
ncbi:MAG: hypothetical protein IH845_05660 [Nanoarchaeota archaeon]|nr:hypothetical protein [Nanoarchaeota archaeon]